MTIHDQHGPAAPEPEKVVPLGGYDDRRPGLTVAGLIEQLCLLDPNALVFPKMAISGYHNVPFKAVRSTHVHEKEKNGHLRYMEAAPSIGKAAVVLE